MTLFTQPLPRLPLDQAIAAEIVRRATYSALDFGRALHAIDVCASFHTWVSSDRPGPVMTECVQLQLARLGFAF